MVKLADIGREETNRFTEVSALDRQTKFHIIFNEFAKEPRANPIVPFFKKHDLFRE